MLISLFSNKRGWYCLSSGVGSLEGEGKAVVCPLWPLSRRFTPFAHVPNSNIWIQWPFSPYFFFQARRIIKGQFLSDHGYMVWEVKDILNRQKRRLGIFSFSFHISYHCHDIITETLLLSFKTTTSNKQTNRGHMEHSTEIHIKTNHVRHAIQIWSD